LEPSFKFKREIKKILPGVKEGVLLKNWTTFRIGGKANYFFEAKNKRELIKAIEVAKKYKIPFFILGGGSNILVADEGFGGMVIKYGESLSHYVFKGLDWAAGIPGTIEGAVYGNASAFSHSIEEVVKEVEVYDIKRKKIKIFKNKDCKFGYRESIFKKNKNLIILSVKIRTKKSNPKKIKECLEYRKNHHPQLPSIGCIFKNFQFKITEFRKLIKKFPQMRQFKERGEIPTAFLITECGLKGKRIGEVQISEKHPNFIVNLGKGKAKDVRELISLAKKKVREKYGIKIEEEIQYLGF